MANSLKVGFIGCGIMGAPIAGHILDAGYEVSVYNRTKAKTDALVARGAVYANSPAEAAKDADVVFTMVGYPTDVEEVYLGSDGILRAAKEGAYLIDLTTSSPQLARDIHDAAEVSGMHAFDCPVTGGESGAIAGTLTLIVGATEQEAAPVAPVLNTFAGKIYYFGHAGAGQIAKLCNQISLAGCMVGMADALALAQQSGVDPSLMCEMVGNGMGGSVALKTFIPKILDGDYNPGFMVEHFRKDIGLALEQSEELQIALPGAETAYALYDTLCTIGGKRLGTQSISLLYAEEADAVAAGLDWGLLDEAYSSENADGQNSCDECLCDGASDDQECCGQGGQGAGKGCCGKHHQEE